MASTDPSLISDAEEHKWVIEINEILKHQLKLEFETPSVSLYQVPEAITHQKPDAYEPQQIGLGPVHHFRPHPYKKMEQKKLAVMRKVLKDHGISNYKLQVLDKVEKLVPAVRSCYDMFLQDTDESLTMIFSIDGLFLLNLLHTYNSPVQDDMNRYLLYLKDQAYEYRFGLGLMDWSSLPPVLRPGELVVTAEDQLELENIMGIDHHQPVIPAVGPTKRLVAQDILMVENQIPFMVLKEIHETLHPLSGDTAVNFSPSVFRIFCEIHSPLKLCSKSLAPSSVDHLLHYMYYSIVNNVAIEKPVNEPSPKTDDEDEPYDSDGVYPIQNNSYVEEVLINFVSNIPREMIVQAYEQTVSILETFTQSKKILVPSASELHDKAGFLFKSLQQDEGIQNIDISGKDIYLPSIALNKDSEIILRNLVAYETLTAANSFLLNEYMGFMCALVTNKDDASYLKSQNVITGELGAEEVAKLFTGISSCIQTMETTGESRLRKLIHEINTVYDGVPEMKTYLLLQKLARWLLWVLRTIGDFVESSWKIVAFMVGIVIVFIFIRQNRIE